MSFVTQHGMIVMVLLAAPVAVGAFLVFVKATRCYEIAVAAIILAAWAHWPFWTNVETTSIAEEVNQDTGPGTVLRIAAVLFAAAAGYLSFFDDQSRASQRVPARLTLLYALVLLGLASTAYSIDKSMTFGRAAEFGIFAGFLLGLHSWLRGPEQFERMMKVLAIVLGFGIVLNASSVVLLPGRAWWWEAPNRLQGMTNQPNELGMMCMIAYPILLWRYRRGGNRAKALCGALLVVTLGMHILSGSRSSLICAGCGLLVWNVSLRQWTKALLLCGVGAVGALLIATSALPSLERTESEQLMDFTGRTSFWTHGMAAVMARPFLGYGYQVAGKVWEDPRYASVALETGWASAHTSLHNGYLDALIGQGLVGLILMLVVLFLPLPIALRAAPSDYRAVALTMLTQIMILNFFETVIIGARSFGSTIFWCFWTMAGALPVLASGGEPAPVAPGFLMPLVFDEAALTPRSDGALP